MCTNAAVLSSLCYAVDAATGHAPFNPLLIDSCIQVHSKITNFTFSNLRNFKSDWDDFIAWTFRSKSCLTKGRNIFFGPSHWYCLSRRTALIKTLKNWNKIRMESLKNVQLTIRVELVNISSMIKKTPGGMRIIFFRSTARNFSLLTA